MRRGCSTAAGLPNITAFNPTARCVRSAKRRAFCGIRAGIVASHRYSGRIIHEVVGNVYEASPSTNVALAVRYRAATQYRRDLFFALFNLAFWAALLIGGIWTVSFMVSWWRDRSSHQREIVLLITAREPFQRKQWRRPSNVAISLRCRVPLRHG